MPTPILTLVTDASDDLGLTRPLSLFASTDEGDTSDRKLLRALTRTCTTLAARHDWQVLRARYSWQAAPQSAQMVQPTDFLRMIPCTFWAESRRLPVDWPISAHDWQQAEAGVSTITTPSAMQEGNVIKILPVPVAGETFSFRYIRNRIGFAADGTTGRARFTDDTDTTLWDDELVTLGIVYHFRLIDRLDYSADQVAFERMIQDRIKADGGTRSWNMASGKHGDADDRLSRMKSAAVVVRVPQS